MNKAIKVIVVVLLSIVIMGQGWEDGKENRLRIGIHPEYFKEIKVDPKDEGSMLCGIKFVVVNENGEPVKGFDVEEFYARSETRSLVTKRDLGEEAWGWLKYIEVGAYKDFPYLDIVMVFSKATLDMLYRGEDVLEVMMLMKYEDGYSNEYRQRWRWEYSEGKWAGGKVWD